MTLHFWWMEWERLQKNRYFSFLLEGLKDNWSKTSSIFLIILSMYVCIIILSHPSLGPGNVTCSSLSLSVDVRVFSFLFFSVCSPLVFLFLFVCCTWSWMYVRTHLYLLLVWLIEIDLRIIVLSTDIQEHEFKSWSDFVSWKEMLKLKASLLFSKVHKQSLQTKVNVATIDGTAENLTSIKCWKKNKITAIMPIKSAINLSKFKIFSSRLTTLLLLLEDDYLFVFL